MVRSGAVFRLDLVARRSRTQHQKSAPAVERVDDEAQENQQQAGVHDVDGHLGDAAAFREQREAVGAYDPFGFQSQVLEGAFGCAQSLLFIGNRNLRLRRQNFAEALVGTLIRTREVSPGVREALHRRGR